MILILLADQKSSNDSPKISIEVAFFLNSKSPQ